ncbi:hypothetical protein [Spirosoma sp. KNUC1025]|uniref:hypothetical protein n=1 Tax=Spirosoma sp. KNUC1025 TaxID=2894082 RepID=UPI00386FCC35|nr:hypothetical protein LN737_17705 [Spirosoma sp. KNUC1025]
MKPDKTNPAGTAQTAPVDEALSYSEFTQLLAQYKRAVYESIYQADDPIKRLITPHTQVFLNGF